jgi:hypothetical protein
MQRQEHQLGIEIGSRDQGELDPPLDVGRELRAVGAANASAPIMQ